MAEGWMPQVVGQRQGLGQILIQPEQARDGARNLGHLQAMGQSRAVVVAFVKNKHLRLVGEAPERGGVHDAVSIALERCAHRTGGFAIKPAAAEFRAGGIGRQEAPRWRPGRRQPRRLVDHRLGHARPRDLTSPRAVLSSWWWLQESGLSIVHWPRPAKADASQK